MEHFMIARLDHIGIAVQNVQDALQFFENALGLKLDHVALEEGGRTEVAFLPVGGSEVELVETKDADSGLGKFLAKRGEGIHHICFEVSDIEGALARLRENGAQLIDETPRTNASGMRYAFIHPKSAHGVLIELYQKP
jgi:methylmalonyl-CoA epimerase